MSTLKPTIIFVPGAWHGPEGFGEVRGLLEAAGYDTIGVSLPSVGADLPLPGFEKDVEVIRALVNTACDDDQDVVIFMHSYGSMPACQAVQGLGKVQRRKDGKPGGVVGLFFCCSFVLPEGVSLLDALGGQPLPWFVISEDGMVVKPAGPEKVFYGDLDDEVAAKWVGMLKPFSYKSMSSRSTYTGWRDIPSTYLFCEKDQAIPIEVQRGMVEGATGAKFRTETCGASHSPFLSMPGLVAEAVRRAAGEVV